MHDQDLRGLLGPAYDTITDEQKMTISQAVDMIQGRWPGDDLYPQRDTALAAALEVILGDGTDQEIAQEFIAAHTAYMDASTKLGGAIIATSLLSDESEVKMAARLGVTRPTIRKALGKKFHK